MRTETERLLLAARAALLEAVSWVISDPKAKERIKKIIAIVHQIDSYVKKS